MTAAPSAPAPAVARPALRRLRMHLRVCRTGDMRRCQVCRWLEADASAEAWREFGGE